MDARVRDGEGRNFLEFSKKNAKKIDKKIIFFLENLWKEKEEEANLNSQKLILTTEKKNVQKKNKNQKKNKKIEKKIEKIEKIEKKIENFLVNEEKIENVKTGDDRSNKEEFLLKRIENLETQLKHQKIISEKYEKIQKNLIEFDPRSDSLAIEPLFLINPNVYSELSPSQLEFLQEMYSHNINLVISARIDQIRVQQEKRLEEKLKQIEQEKEN